MKAKENKSAFLEYFGDTPKLRVLDFLIGEHFFDFNLTDIARESNVSYNSLKSFLDEFLEKKIIVKTRRIGKSDMFQLNLKNQVVLNLIKMAWIPTKADLGIKDKQTVKAKS